MAQLTYNTNVYRSVNKYSVDDLGEVTYNGILIASKLNQKNGQDYKLLDAIDIDWNGAHVKSLDTYLYTTEDLLFVLDELNKNTAVDDINNNLIEVWRQLNEITSTYITYTSLYEILDNSYQKTLIGGDFITIDSETNVITTYDLASYLFLENNYTSKEEHEDLWRNLQQNYYDIATANKIIQQFVKEGIDEVINGADSAFDTLKEIADWILDQNRYVPVTPQEVIDALNNPDNTDEYYYKNEEGSYIQITDPNEVITDGSVEYFRLENYFTDIKRLIKDVDELQDTVGYSYLSYVYNEETGEITYLNNYTYTGILKDIDDLQTADKEINTKLNEVETKANDAFIISSEALRTANTAYETANTAYETANSAYDLASYSVETAELAYSIAKKASEDVGIPSVEGRGWVEINFADIQSYYDSGEIIYIYNKFNHSYIEAEKPYLDTDIHYIWEEDIDGTGLTGRVEIVENEVDEANRKSEEAIQQAKESLYNLLVDNSNSSYITLNLTPDFYEGSPKRILHINTEEALFNAETGEILNNGIPTIMTVQDIYSYASSWQILDNVEIL